MESKARGHFGRGLSNSALTSVRLPARLRLGAGLLEMDVLVHVIHPGERNEMMLAAGIRIVLGQFHLVPPFQVVHGSNVHAVRPEHFHMFLDHHRCDHVCSSIVWEENAGRGWVVPPRRRERHCASAARMRAQLRVPLWNEVRSYFSFGECTRSSSSAKPTMMVSIPSTRLKSPTIGIEPPSPIAIAFLPHSAASAKRVLANAGLSNGSSIPAAPAKLLNSTLASAGSRARTKA